MNKRMKFLFSRLQSRVGAVGAGLAVSGSALADSVDYSSLTSAVSYSGVIVALLVVLAAGAGLDVVMKGGTKILSAIRRS